jgi:hypothetical protein
MKKLSEVTKQELEMICFKVNQIYLHALPEGPHCWSKVDIKSWKDYIRKSYRIEANDGTYPAIISACDDNRVVLETQLISDAEPYVQFDCSKDAHDFVDKIGGIALC